jgi:hypothetical protein
MLDELDALMEKMLSLPVNKLEEAPEPPPTPAALDAPPVSYNTSVAVEAPPTRLDAPPPNIADLSAAFPHVQEDDAVSTVPPPTWLEDPPPIKVEAPAPPPSPRRIVERPTSYQLEEEGSVSAVAPPLSTKPVADAAPQETKFFRKDPPASLDELLPPLIVRAPAFDKLRQRARRRSLGGWLFLPLLWINQTFDRLTYSLGDAGTWLRSARGRKVIGSAGLLLLTLAGLWWLHDLLGWTWLSDPLQ